ncbi:hypothetical protein ABG79_02074 [Caloramator mitchellensis]|uniref:Uncharacterized protein n=1 Tax=Caloramator mitchellensis TaxID=908809 RepID=A0A0R3JRM1_CALMK|nr:hypothetical protein [Caloramator mitchellensis]KRQ86135.1 hypothetical protein ABG79_02074 [Caloramator mitchellensis]
MPHKKRHNNERDDNVKNIQIPDLDLQNFNLEDVLKNIDKEKLNNLLSLLNTAKKQSGREVEVLAALKEFLPERRRRIVDKLISVLSGEIYEN